MVKAQRILTDGITTDKSERHTNVPWGICGGRPGAVGKRDFSNIAGGDNRAMPSNFHGLAVKKCDVMACYSPCGGGYGCPLERDLRKVLDDVLDGFCSAGDAAEVYGFVLDLDAETVDLAVTQAGRATLELRRIGMKPDGNHDSPVVRPGTPHSPRRHAMTCFSIGSGAG